MLSEHTFLRHQNNKSDKASFIIYADLIYYLIDKIDGCKNNPKNSSTTKISENQVFQCLQYHHLKA